MTNYEMKPIKQFNGEYWITTKGKVINIKEDTFVAQYEMSNQTRVTIKYDGKIYSCGVARLVAEAFLPSPQPTDKLYVQHKDGNFRNNNVDNLQWMTRSEAGIYQCYCLGCRVKPVRCIETGVEYPSVSEASRQTGISHIHQVCKGDRKTAGGYHWEYIRKEVD